MLMNLIYFLWNQFMTFMYLIIECNSRIPILLLSCFMSIILMLHFKAGIFLLCCLRKPKPQIPNSPINIVPSRVNRVLHTRLSQLHWIDYDKLPLDVYMQNNGKTVIIHIRSALNCRPHLCGGSLLGNYYFVEATFKWGGSEHRIDSRSFAMEMQVLHAADSTNVPFEYLTISYLFVVTNFRSNAMQKIVEYLCALIHPNSVIQLPTFDLSILFWRFHSEYYSYSGTYSNGRVTFPTQWHICTSIFHISEEQLNQFNFLRNSQGESIERNARLPMPINKQVVKLFELSEP